MARLLIVDDQKGVRMPLGHLAESAGHHVTLVESAEAALDVLGARMVDILVTDVCLGGMSGLDLLRRVSVTYPRMRVVLTTGEPSVDTMAVAIRYGAFDFLLKPVTQHDFIDALDRAVAALGDEITTFLACAIAQASIDSIFGKDLDYRYTYVNGHMAALLGRPVDELVGKTPEEVFEPDDAKTVRAVDARCLGGATVTETRTLDVGGQARVFHTVQFPVRDAEGRIVGECGIVRDITALWQAERAAAEARDMLAAAEALAHVGSCYWNMRTGQVVWSEELKCIFGVDPEAYGNDIAAIIDDRVHPDERVYVKTALRGIVEQGEARPIEYRIVRPDGVARMVRTEGRVLMGGDGNPEALHACVVDITDRRLAERALEKAQAQLVQAERFAAIGRVSTGIAHEMSEPLTEIVRLADTLKVPPDASAPEEDVDLFQQTLAVIRAHAERCLSFVEEFEGEVRRGAGQTVLVNVCRTVQDVLDGRAADPRLGDRLLLQAQDRVTMEDLPTLGTRADTRIAGLAESEAWIRCVAGQWELVVGNLIDNALDATVAGDTVAIACRREGDGIVVTVADTGEGIPPERIRYVFEPFYSTRQTGGRGFGLYSCRRVVEKMGGLIDCQSAVGVGTVMRVWLPLARAGG
jgi:two-component system, cell cycle sensor histidine kinase PleC